MIPIENHHCSLPEQKRIQIVARYFGKDGIHRFLAKQEIISGKFGLFCYIVLPSSDPRTATQGLLVDYIEFKGPTKPDGSIFSELGYFE